MTRQRKNIIVLVIDFSPLVEKCYRWMLSKGEQWYRVQRLARFRKISRKMNVCGETVQRFLNIRTKHISAQLEILNDQPTEIFGTGDHI